MELVGEVAVIVAKHFNPSILTQLWLVRNGIMSDEDFEPGCIFTDELSQVEGRSFRLIAVFQHLQFMPKHLAIDDGVVVMDKLGGIVRALPHTPYSAIGLNFTWHEIIDDTRAITRELFFVDRSALHQAFDTPDSYFGAYLSKDWESMRLKLDIKPLTLNVNGVEQRRLHFSFNFHRDLSAENAVMEIEECLQLWDRAKIASQELVEIALRGIHI